MDVFILFAMVIGLMLIGAVNAFNEQTNSIKNLETGEYGECKVCGEAIGLARLRARPVAELCIECKSEQEKLERRTG